METSSVWDEAPAVSAYKTLVICKNTLNRMNIFRIIHIYDSEYYKLRRWNQINNKKGDVFMCLFDTGWSSQSLSRDGSLSRDF